MYHAKDGLYFKRQENGKVFIKVERPRGTGLEPEQIFQVEIEPEGWASVVSAVSKRGENGPTYREALNYHQTAL